MAYAFQPSGSSTPHPLLSQNNNGFFGTPAGPTVNNGSQRHVSFAGNLLNMSNLGVGTQWIHPPHQDRNQSLSQNTYTNQTNAQNFNLHGTSDANNTSFVFAPPSNNVHSNSSLTSSNNNRQRELEPPTFNGRESWSMFLFKFEQIACFNQWDDQTKRIRLLIGLLGDALEFSVVIPNLDIMSYNDIKLLLRQRFGEPSNEDMYRSKFKSRSRLENENVHSYLLDLQSLAGKAYPGETGPLFHRMICDQFIEGLGHRDCREYLMLELGRTRQGGMALIQEVLELTYRYISCKGPLDKIRKPSYNDRDHYPTQNRQNGGNQYMEPAIHRQRSYMEHRDHGYDKPSIICSFCNRPGHVASRCWENKAQAGN